LTWLNRVHTNDHTQDNQLDNISGFEHAR
jgi:hypothetical protein